MENESQSWRQDNQKREGIGREGIREKHMKRKKKKMMGEREKARRRNRQREICVCFVITDRPKTKP